MGNLLNSQMVSQRYCFTQTTGSRGGGGGGCGGRVLLQRQKADRWCVIVCCDVRFFLLYKRVVEDEEDDVVPGSQTLSADNLPSSSRPSLLTWSHSRGTRRPLQPCNSCKESVGYWVYTVSEQIQRWKKSTFVNVLLARNTKRSELFWESFKYLNNINIDKYWVNHCAKCSYLI